MTSHQNVGNFIDRGKLMYKFHTDYNY